VNCADFVLLLTAAEHILLLTKSLLDPFVPLSFISVLSNFPSSTNSNFCFILSLNQQVQIDENFCGMDVNQPLGGVNPIETEPVLTYDNVVLTSVAATSTHDFTVAFLGTSTGHLKKVTLPIIVDQSIDLSSIRL